jgi:hypothetical protein
LYLSSLGRDPGRIASAAMCDLDQPTGDAISRNTVSFRPDRQDQSRAAPRERSVRGFPAAVALFRQERVRSVRSCRHSLSRLDR